MRQGSSTMKFIRGKAGEIINLEYVEIIDVIYTGKHEVQAKMGEFSVVLADFEVVEHARAYLDNLWKDAIWQEPQESLAV